MPERMISGLQLGLVDKTSLSIGEWIELLHGTYVVASIDGVEEFRTPAYTFPTLGSGEWFDLGLRPLPLSKTRFDIPAFVFLNYRFVSEQQPRKSQYGWSVDPETDRELQRKYGDSAHKPKE